MQQDTLLSLNSIDEVQQAMLAQHYIADRSLATVIYLSLKRQKPLLLEGEPGVGKTEIARVLATLLNTRLIRLQCYEGIDIHTAVYEWNYTRQMIHIRLLEATGHAQEQQLQDIFSPAFLLQRPLLQAIDPANSAPPVLLIDELDRSDEEFEAYLLELLSEFQITIPEIGPIRATHPPHVIITSNRTREIHDALRRRCLYHWIDFPTLEKEYQIITTRLPEAPLHLAQQVTAFVQELRTLDLYKAPGIAETLDWTASLLALQRHELTDETIQETVGALLKYQDDIEKINAGFVKKLLQKLRGRT